MITSEERGPEFSAGLGGILGIKLSGKKGLSTEYEITPADKALLIELVERRGGGLYAVDSNMPMGLWSGSWGKAETGVELAVT